VVDNFKVKKTLSRIKRFSKEIQLGRISLR